MTQPTVSKYWRK